MKRLELLQRHLAPQPSRDHDSPLPLTALCSAPAHRGGAVLIGGMVMDIQAHPTSAADVRRGGSVPGRVRESPGGVARNVAESLAALCRSGGAPAPVLVSAVGDDLAGEALLAHWRSLGMTTEGITVHHGQGTPSVAIVFDRSGEVAASVADVGLLEQALTPTAVRQQSHLLAGAPVLMLDGNLSPAAIQEACAQAASAGVPIWFEPVSQPKSVRATAVLHLLDFISPNEGELVAMAGAVLQQQQRQQEQEQRQQQQQHREGGGGSSSSLGGTRSSSSSSTWQLALAVPAASGSGRPGSGSQRLPPEVAAALEPLLPHVGVLLRAGVKHIVLTLGALGAVLCTLRGRDSGQCSAALLQHLPALPAKVANCSGAGDCLVAGCLFGLSQGCSPLRALACGVAASKRAVESQQNVPPRLTAEGVERDAAVVLQLAAETEVGL